MSRARRWFGRLAIALACMGWAGAGQAEELAIQSLNGAGRLVFNELTSATNYHVEWASSPAGPWTNFIGEALARLDSIPATGLGSVTCAVPVFYRVVAAVTNGWLALDVAGDLDFGSVGVGSTSSRELTLMNRGVRPLTVTGVECPVGFSCGWTGVIPAGYQQVVAVTFEPLGEAECGGTLTIHSDADGGTFTLAVSGRGSSEYLVLDLSEGPSAETYPVTYLAAPPGGGWSDVYKTTKLVLHRIPATAPDFTMGSPSDEVGRQPEETQHAVTLSQGFYVGVFEITQKQWERVRGTWPSYFNNASYRDTRPVEQVSYAVRGSSAGAGWPANNSVDATSFFGLLRAKTGLAFDLPTESQWEYACRAGTTTALNSGYNLTSAASDARMAEVGRYNYNRVTATTQGDDTSKGTAKVGSFLPNAWGLYDMHGNVWEWCLDWKWSYPGTVTDPKGASSGSNRVFRGGGWNHDAGNCRSATKGGSTPSFADWSVGFRVVLPPVQP